MYESDSSDKPAFRALRERCKYIMATRALEMASAMQTNGRALTRALQSVLPVPDDLKWTQLSVSGLLSASFEATGVDFQNQMHLYSVNLLNGCVLRDGNTLKSLPSQILGHPLYERTFGTRDFEVSLTEQGRLLAKRELGGCVYEFALGYDGDLRVYEYHGEKGVQLELLDAAKASEWGASLPIRIREMYATLKSLTLHLLA